MIGDIEIPKAKEVHVVAVREWDKDFTGQQWNIYLINNRPDTISTVLVMSRGKSDDQKTSTLRHFLGDIKPQSAEKIEFITEEVLGFTNEYLLTFFAEDKLFERSFSFAPNTINEKEVVKLPVMEVEGILAK